MENVGWPKIEAPSITLLKPLLKCFKGHLMKGPFPQLASHNKKKGDSTLKL